MAGNRLRAKLDVARHFFIHHTLLWYVSRGQSYQRRSELSDREHKSLLKLFNSCADQGMNVLHVIEHEFLRFAKRNVATSPDLSHLHTRFYQPGQLTQDTERVAASRIASNLAKLTRLKSDVLCIMPAPVDDEVFRQFALPKLEDPVFRYQISQDAGLKPVALAVFLTAPNVYLERAGYIVPKDFHDHPRMLE